MVKRPSTYLCSLLLTVLATGGVVATACAHQSVTGRVIEALTRRPIPGAHVRVGIAGRHSRVADSNGGFVIETPAFPCSLQVSAAGFDSALVVAHTAADSIVIVELRGKEYTLHEMVVTGVRFPTRASEFPSSVSVVPRASLERSPGTMLSDALVSLVGVVIKDYGGPAGLKTISQRGLGAEHTLVMVDGMPINNAQTGLVDLGSIPDDWVEQVEVLRGGQSASFGTQAIGGTVNLVPRLPQEGISASASFAGGSFGYQRLSVGAGFGAEGSGGRISISQERSVGDYPFFFSDGARVYSLTRMNSDYLLRSLFARGVWQVSPSTRIHGMYAGLESDRGVSGPVVSVFADGVARQHDVDHLVQLNGEGAIGTAAHYTVQGQARWTYQRYSDPDIVIAGIPLDNYSRFREFRLEPRLGAEVSPAIRASAGAMLSYASAEGTTLSREPQRTIGAAYGSAELRGTPASGVVREILVVPAARYDKVGDDIGAFSPQLGLQISSPSTHVGIFQNATVAIRASVSRNFRAPTFNELYYSGGGGFGNPELRPEHARSVDAGADIGFELLGIQRLSGTVFSNALTDRIVWVPGGSRGVTPVNLQTVESRGVECQYRWALFGERLALDGTYANVESKKTSGEGMSDPTEGKHLVYIPQETAGVSLTYDSDVSFGILVRLAVVVRYRYTGFRFMTADNEIFLPSYDLVDAAVTVDVRLSEVTGSLKFEISNIGNESYQMILGYPAPPRSFRLSASFSI